MAVGKINKKKLYDRNHVRVFSRHPTHKDLRMQVETRGNRVLLRLGSTTESNWPDIEINTVEGIRNSSNKIRMKQIFHQNNINSPDFILVNNGRFDYYKTNEAVNTGLTVNQVIELLTTKKGISSIVRKKCFRSRGNGMAKLDTEADIRSELNVALNYRGDNPIYFERFTNYTREYRLHINAITGRCFYTCRKMLKEDTPEKDRWFRNDSNCTWYLESNPNFNRPQNWDSIVNNCVVAMRSVGLDIGAFDVKVSKGNDFSILEVNSAPSFGELTLENYKNELPSIINQKINNVRNIRL